jgi:chemotaxis methyl-accepting protein methylase/signal transduction histidine kinase/chemotaxis response regulator CheB
MKDLGFPVAGIGASAGGLDAFHGFFAHMPSDCGMAFVTILHLPADRKSLLPEILARWTRMRVIDVVDGQRVEPNCVYVPPPHSIATFMDGRLKVRMPAAEELTSFRPIDTLFDSLASSLQEMAIGIVLSGTGSDGALGLKAIKTRGGLTIAQGAGTGSPQYADMPAGAVATGSVDIIAAIEDIPGHLLRMRGSRLAILEQSPDAAEQVNAARLRICAILRAQLGHDFSNYRDKTFLRRVQRRMQVVNVATLSEYVGILEANPSEVVSLFRDLLIRVTSFFRDRETFEILETAVIPRLFAGKQADGTVRVWVPGCATGEEAYSLAILLREHMDRSTGSPKVQIFATDIDDAAITTARVGVYPPTLLTGLSPQRQERFFKAVHGGFAVVKAIRDLCTFSMHNLVRDPPFSRMDLVSCRNLLIYLDAQLQEAIIPVFHYALAPRGILLLGSSESATKHADLFEPVNKAARIFERRQVPSPPLNLASRSLDLNDRSPAKPPRSAPAKRRPDDVGGSDAEGEVATDSPDPRYLQHALVGTQEELQSLAEEHQTALEELRSSNEELHSVNEEMQSTNEELETAKEELQSLNEELSTVNARLTDKVNELDHINADLRNLFDSTQIATIFLDRHLIVRSFTPAIATLYNLIPSDEGRPLTDIVSRLHYSGLREDVERVLETLRPLERRIAREDRSSHYVMRIMPYRGPDSVVDGAVVTFIDVTSIVQAEATLREADVRKDVFLATLSHELRNPLAPIRNAAQLLKAKNLDPAQLETAQSIITRQVTHMSSLLDDLLDVSRITRGSFVLKRAYVDLNDIFDAAAEAVQPLVDAKRHTLRVERGAEPLTLEVDSVRLTQVVSNLLTNAAKYTPAGGQVTVGSRRESARLIIFVKDNGIGLAPDALAQVFTMFTPVDSDVGRSEGGLGIGLALVKGLVELHGGRIEAVSAGPGKGSEFIVSLPASVVVDPALVKEQASGGAQAVPVSRRVLVADDNIDGAVTLGMVLEMAGHEIQLAHTGKDAFDAAARFRPDIAILDIGMPDLSGYEVAKRIRHEAWGAGMRLIAVTGWGQEQDKRMAFAAGFDHHLTKPVDPERLGQLLGEPVGR